MLNIFDKVREFAEDKLNLGICSSLFACGLYIFVAGICLLLLLCFGVVFGLPCVILSGLINVIIPCLIVSVIFMIEACVISFI